MARGGKKAAKNEAAEANPEAEERSRLKKIAFSKRMLSETPAKGLTALSPSKIVTKHHGRDILRKSQRKNRFLFSFPGLIAPVSGGKIGELKDLGTKNPILYLDFPQGQMKLFGTIVYPENRYLTLQFSRGGKNVMCEDYFDTMIAFSDAWWIGTKEENPEEARLEFPKELHSAQEKSFDFTGGAGAASKTKSGINKSALKHEEPESPKTDPEDDSMDCQNDSGPVPQITPTRHSERTAGKRFKFQEPSSGEDIADDDASSEEDQKSSEDLDGEQTLSKSKSSRRVVFDIDSEEAAECTEVPGQVQKSDTMVTKSVELSHAGHGSLVQTTISTLFKKVEEKAPEIQLEPSSSKAPSQKPKRGGSGKKTSKSKDEEPPRKGKALRTKKLVEDDDDIEDFSSPSKETSESDEDWAG